MSVNNTLLPLNSNLAIVHAAATPNTRFNGTAIPAAISVRRIADNASGSVIESRYTCQPFLKASLNTATNSTNKNKVRKPNAANIRAYRIQRGSVVAARLSGGSTRRTGVAGCTEIALIPYSLLLDDGASTPAMH